MNYTPVKEKISCQYAHTVKPNKFIQSQEGDWQTKPFKLKKSKDLIWVLLKKYKPKKIDKNKLKCF